MADRDPRFEARARARQAAGRRTRSLAWGLLAVVYGYFAYQLTTRAATPFEPSAARLLLAQSCLVLLLLTGFGAMEILGQGERAPLTAMGLPRRSGAGAEFGLGAALGWAAVVAAVLPVALFGSLLVTVSSHGPDAARGVLVSLVGCVLSALASELLLRGYAFQRLLDASGPTIATIVMLLLVTLSQGFQQSWTAGSLLVCVLFNTLLAMAYLRTRALWVGYGLHFAWNASLLVLFGLPVSGLGALAPALSTYTDGAAWLAGGRAGPEGSAVMVLVLLAALWVLARTTRELRHQWALPEIVGAGIPVDIDAAARKQHERAMGEAAPAQPALVQIAPVATAPLELPKRPE